MKNQYEDYIKFCDKKIAAKWALIIDLESMVERTNKSPLSIEMLQEASEDYQSWLANKATLERHKEQLVPTQFFPERPARIVCSFCESWKLGKLSVLFPCPSLLDVTNQLDEVMGE